MHAELEESLEIVSRLRAEGARVHSITNTVAQNFTANVLLACGAAPSMTVNPDEVEVFTKRADSLHINLGTLDRDRMTAIGKSLEVANAEGMPVLLDPVMANVSLLRAEFANEYADKFGIIRGNEEEISSISMGDKQNLCIVQTGKTDCIKLNGRSIFVTNGHPLMAKVIATGCALGALISALAAKTNSPEIASLAGLLWFGVAGELAAEKVSGPGSFSPAFLDCLHNIDLETLKERARVE